MNQLYDLKGYKRGRRAGLTAAAYRGPQLLQSLKRPIIPNTNPNDMRTKSSGRTIPAKKEPLKEPSKDFAQKHTSLSASPVSSSDEDDSADIKPTIFGKRSKSPTPDIKGAKTRVGGKSVKNATVHAPSARSARNGKTTVSPSSSSGSSATSTKRRSQEDQWLKKGVGKGMVDAFGRVQTKKAKTNTYTTKSNQPRFGSSQSTLSSKMNAGSPQASRQVFKAPDPLNLDSPVGSQSTPDVPKKSSFMRPEDIEDTPQKPSTPARKSLIQYEKVDDTPTSTPGANKTFQIPNQEGSLSFGDNEDDNSFTDPSKIDNIPVSTPPLMKNLFQRPANAVQRDPKKPLDLKNVNLDRGLASRVQDIVGQDVDESGDPSGLFDDDFETSMTIEARCPMCNQPCDAAELKKWGTMNTRQQERFCRSHRKTMAEKKWSSKGYPEIDWEKIDLRISEHHDLIKDILNGADCHFRKTFEEMVAAGKGRALRKMESNLTPGYYGSRGLNTISEHVIREFSELLSKRSVKDRLISKRGTTAFVQSVIVPEVAVQLIMNDMSLDDAEARDVLTDSSNMGELVHEEIRDVVMEGVEDSEDDDDNQY